MASAPPSIKARVAAAAAAAAASVTPAQRDVAIQQAVLKAHEQLSATEQPVGDAPSQASHEEALPPAPQQVSSGIYQEPDWAGAPEGVPYALEVLKNGAVVDTLDLQQLSHLTFGRSPTAGVLLEHPSASRLHAVIQFRGEDKAAFLYDCGSTHGTFLNKERVKAHVYIPLRIGSNIRFGQSIRSYVFIGPSELLPPEGLSKAERRQLAQLEAAQQQRDRDQQLAQAQLQAAIHGSGVSWGINPDQEAAGESEEVDWRRYSEKNQLTDKQQKLVEKIRKREYKMKHMQTECDRISVKEKSEGGLTSGQAAALVRNEKAIAALQEEVEDLEDTLNDSIRDSIKGRVAASKGASAGASAAAAKRKRRAGSDDEYADASDSDDEFFDRTGAAGTGRARKQQRGALGGAQGPGGGKGQQQQQGGQVESAESLYGKRAAFQEDIQRLEAAVAAEQARLQQQLQQQPPAAAAGEAAAAAGGGGAEAAAGGGGAAGSEPAAKEPTAAADGGEGVGAAEGAAAQAEDTAAAAGVDSLDAFMADVAVQMEADKVGSLQQELASVRQQLQRVEKLLRIVDPDGWYQPGSAAAAALAKSKAREVLESERKKKQAAIAAAEEKRRRQQQAASATAGGAGEDEEDEADDIIHRQQQQQTAATGGGGGEGAGASIHHLAGSGEGDQQQGGLQQRQRPQGPPAAAASPPVAAAGGAAAAGTQLAAADPQRSAAEQRAAQLMKEFSSVHSSAGNSSGTKRPVKGAAPPPPKFQGGAGDPSGSAAVAPASAAAARVAASLALLTSGGRSTHADFDEEEAEGVEAIGVSQPQSRQQRQQQQQEGAAGDTWVPPQGQTGDGKTRLNEKYGY